MYLAADIGGTKSHLALYANTKKYLPVREKKFESKKYPNLESILQEFLEESPQDKIVKACFGIAGPITEGKSETPNLPWIVEDKKLKKLLNTEKVAMINDLVANSYGLDILGDQDFFVLNKGKKFPCGNQAMISAGTGLGEVGRVFDGKRYITFASEGGHCDFLVRNEEELGLFHYLKKKFKGHVSIERALSGPGLENIYHYLVETKKAKPHPSENKEGKSLAKVISDCALKKTCPTCTKALDMFIEIYGAEAGNLALKFFATGGVFIGGGIAPKILEALKTSCFMQAFVAKGRVEHVLHDIPIKVILNENTALLGAAYYADQSM